MEIPQPSDLVSTKWQRISMWQKLSGAAIPKGPGFPPSDSAAPPGLRRPSTKSRRICRSTRVGSQDPGRSNVRWFLYINQRCGSKNCLRVVMYANIIALIARAKQVNPKSLSSNTRKNVLYTNDSRKCCLSYSRSEFRSVNGVADEFERQLIYVLRLHTNLNHPETSRGRRTPFLPSSVSDVRSHYKESFLKWKFK